MIEDKIKMNMIIIEKIKIMLEIDIMIIVI